MAGYKSLDFIENILWMLYLKKKKYNRVNTARPGLPDDSRKCTEKPAIHPNRKNSPIILDSVIKEQNEIN